MSQIQITSQSFQVSGSTVTVSKAPASASYNYYRLAYEGTSSFQPVYFDGYTQTTKHLSCWDTFPEILTFATSSGITTILKDPKPE